MRSLLFVLLSILTVGGGLWVLVRKSPVDSALGLLVTMVAIAGHYMMLRAPFLAAVQLIVYGGAVVILFLFVIMLLNLKRETLQARRMPPGRWLYAVAGVIVMLAMTGVFRAGFDWHAGGAPVTGTVEAFGAELFRRWVYPFELTSVLLLAALLGAVALTRRDQEVEPGGDQPEGDA